MIRTAAAFLCAVLAARSAPAQMSAADQALVERYRAAIGAAEAGTKAGAAEAAFSMLPELRDVLLKTTADGTVLESLSDAEFDRLSELPGAIINREEVLLVEPDADYFGKIASRHGDGADRAFFAALKATYPDSVWPIYLEQQTDITACTRFGSGALVDTYGWWLAFRQNFPTRYVAGARKELDTVGEQLTGANCSCGPAASVENELRRFLARFQDASIRRAVTDRLKSVVAGTAGVRASCMTPP